VLELENYCGFHSRLYVSISYAIQELTPPKRAHSGIVPPVDTIRCLFGGDFREGSSRRPIDMLPPVHLLDAIIRRTILPRPNFRDGTTRLQQWLLSHLVRGITFDIWDLMLCELEDTIYESFSAKRHMNYAHWISFLIYMGVEPMPAASV
jgi:hypothetical protein